MAIEFLLQAFREYGRAEAIISGGETTAYSQLGGLVTAWRDRISDLGVRRGTVVALEADISADAAAALLALVEAGCIVVPVHPARARSVERLYEIAQVALVLRLDPDQVAERIVAATEHPIFAELRRRDHPGLVLFSSGTSGEPKAAVHDFAQLLEKFRTRRPALRAVNFLLFEHIGGLNTLLHTLSNGGTVISLRDRGPDAVCAAIERHRAELLPTSPTFLNLLLLSEAHRRHDLSSLRLISYGTEPMPPSTLTRLRAAFPGVQLLQTYGLAELGILRSRSRSNDSLWVKVGGEGFETRVVDGMLEIKAQSAMLGYLNAPSPFTGDGWFQTGDAVEVDGEYLRILGRKSELINVGGEKVYPAEVEGVIQEVANVEEATVFAEKNPLTGNIVCARVKLAQPEEPAQVALRIRRHCRDRLEKYKVPVRVMVVEDELHGDRFKKVRGGFAEASSR